MLDKVNPKINSTGLRLFVLLQLLMQKDQTKAEIFEYFKNISDSENIVTFELFKEKFQFCDGCNYCEENEKCKYRDLDLFFDEFENTDIVVFASPIYNGGFSAPLKALVDRFQFYYTYFYKNNKTQKITKKSNFNFILRTRWRKMAFSYRSSVEICVFNIEFGIYRFSSL